jgi:hypothetical protein
MFCVVFANAGYVVELHLAVLLSTNVGSGKLEISF